MAMLLVQQGDTCRGVVLGDRLVLGRAGVSDLVIPDSRVSRLHAWISLEGPHYFITDNGSSNGTFVNGVRIESRRQLRPGDRIHLGRVRLRLHEADALPPDAVPVAEAQPSDDLLACTCGAPIWKGMSQDAVLQCRQCGQEIAGDAGGSESSHSAALTCAICQCELLDHESQTYCPDCTMSFHAACWEANRGCAAYGCGQVNILDADEPAPSYAPSTEGEMEEEVVAPPITTVPWEQVLLPASFVAGVVGLLLFGVPSLIAGALAMYWYARSGPRHGGSQAPWCFIAALVIAAVGMAGGFIVSNWWWFSPGAEEWLT